MSHNNPIDVRRAIVLLTSAVGLAGTLISFFVLRTWSGYGEITTVSCLSSIALYSVIPAVITFRYLDKQFNTH